jgi:hypothetical protein
MAQGLESQSALAAIATRFPGNSLNLVPLPGCIHV